MEVLLTHLGAVAGVVQSHQVPVRQTAGALQLHPQRQQHDPGLQLGPPAISLQGTTIQLTITPARAVLARREPEYFAEMSRLNFMYKPSMCTVCLWLAFTKHQELYTLSALEEESPEEMPLENAEAMSCPQAAASGRVLCFHNV